MAIHDLRELREKSGVTLKALAKELRVDVGFLSRVERGVVNAPAEIVHSYTNRFSTTKKPKGETGLTKRSSNYPQQYQLPLETPEIELLPRPGTSLSLTSIPPTYYPSLNPHLADFVDGSITPKVVEEPYSENISAGKNTYVYDAHTYHTKVPPQGIALLIDYYTRPGDVIMDPFCGSGMTGVATAERKRKAILNDLSPAATFIAYNLNTPVSVSRYMEAVHSLLEEGKDLEQHLYTTHCRSCGKPTPIEYMVWSYGMQCKSCRKEFVLWDVARDEKPSVKKSKIKTEFDCPHCGTHLKKRNLEKTDRYPVQVGYKCCQSGRKESVASPDKHDLELLREIEERGIPDELWYPTNLFPDGVNTRQPIDAGITSVDQAYTTRALWAMAFLWDRARRWPDIEIQPKLLFTLTSLYKRVTVFSEFRFWGGSGNTANFNVPAVMNEQNVFKTFERKAKTISWYFGGAPQVPRDVRISTQSACHLPQIPDASIDYIFTDPPFGGNINYSEMNFLWESWLGVHTDITEEAIVNKVQGKDVSDYGNILAQAFSEANRVLKDSGWLTVVFHNSSAKVWDALQNAISKAGFAIKGTQIFDKKHGTFKQFVSDNTVGYDLVLHCRKSRAQRSPQKNGKMAARQDALLFIRRALNESQHDYIVHYQHVSRKDEFDYRLLYAEWLADVLPKMAIGLSFEEFREAIDQVLRG